MAKALKAVGTAIVIVGAVVATGGAALALGAGATLGGSIALASSTVLSIGGFSVSAGALLGVGSLVTSLGGALSQPKVSTAGNALGWVGDPNGPMHFAAGRIAVGGDLRHKKAYGPNDRMYFSAVTVVSDAGPITAFESFTANDVPVTFDGSGKANSSYYANVMWRRTQLGNQPEPSYLASPSGLEGGATLPNWGASHKLSGKAAFILTLAENSKQSAYKGQQPKPQHIIRGLKAYDWRLDSTYPGGSGPHRLDQPATWTYTANPILWAVKWILGLWEGPDHGGAPQLDTQVGGMGVKIENIDLPAFTEAANIADTHGWSCAAWPSTDDDKAQVLDAFLQAGGAYYIQRGGKESCLHRAAPRVSVATISAADTAGPIELDTGASFKQRKNCGVPTYLSEADGWKMTALGLVSSEQWIEEDGGRERSAPVTYSYVSNAKQAAELMCLAIAHTREGIRGRIPLKPYMQGIQPGSAFTITEPEFVLNGLKCLCLETDYDAMTGVHTVTFVSESDGKYDFAFGQTPNPPAPPALEAVDPTYVTPPLPGDWTITIPAPPADGAQYPVIDLSGFVSNDTADSMLIYWREVVEGEDPAVEPLFFDPVAITQEIAAGWVDAGVWPPTTKQLSVTGIRSGATVWLAVRYRRGSNVSLPKLIGPITVQSLAATIPPEVIEGIVSDVLGQVEAGLDDIDGSEELAEVVLETILNEQQGLEQEASQRIEDIQREAAQRDADLMAEAQARGENIAEVQQEVSAVADDLSAEVQTRTSQIAATNQSVALSEQSAKTYADGRYALVQQNFTTIAAFNSGLASTLQSAQSYTDAFEAEAALTYATTAALGTGLAGTLTESKSYTNGQVSAAMTTVYTKAQTDSGLATTLQSSKSYTDDYKTEASQTFSTKTERANGDAAAVLQANAYTDDFKTEASLTYATQASLGSGLASTLTEAKSYSDGQLATAMNTVYTKAQTDSGLSSTLQQATAYSDSQAQQASLTYATKTERANGDAATLQSANSYTDALRSEANLTFATQSSLGGVSATAALALSTAQDAASDLNEARVRLIAAASGGNPALIELYSGTGGGSNVIISAAQIGFGGNTVFEDATDTLRTVTGSVCRIDAWGAPFGPDNLVYWEGPTGIATASVTKAQAENNGGQWRDSTGASYFGGKTLAGPFDSGAGSTVTVPSTAYVDVAVAPAFRTISVSQILTYLTGAVRMQAPADPESGASAAWRVVHTDTSGGDVVVMRSGSFLAAATGSIVSQSVEALITQANANWWASVAAGRSGDRVVRFQLARSGPTIFLDIQTPRVRGFYAT